ncbi:YfbK domain-containing protein [Cellulophaga lytica]|uniref:von Willebrand factor type A n=1 Tax=Cellulophaga lytica (strain ATCC 23178 / DSM 7489 / JCM 8516 / NBRC 14961 / NCIMB 1423 / VKM B-1433 / Cy l20) TaxID=867900 RepID=F0RAF2_CELLC|nr:von Willebrand factor type A domain-containing protein [Cellulophaga lytica]ADY30515.1 von Willebrand factor type A [Cellulophaga lytica DSM 7489]AIM61506.1 von Willebrand factor A [Cellulophaga lytica]WQG78555.1 von Willebrand factor type A domain-containing protein [Cellulophaga lytica]
MKNLLFILCVIVCSIQANAQELTITGTVTDVTGPLPGVNIISSGTKYGTTTDFDGLYTIKTRKGDTLAYTYIGYKYKEVVVKDSLKIDVVLEEDNATLEEVVVVAYGTTSRKSYTGSNVRKVTKREKIQNNISSQLTGNVAGVQVTKGAKKRGKPIQIRGVSSINTAKDPLYIVNGVPAKEGNRAIYKIKPSKITSMKVFKSPKARVLFGDSAKNGCIVITTKGYTNTINYDEEYAKLSENQFKKATLNPLSTFSIDVDKAGYSNVRRMINNGDNIPYDAVKIEEMVNYFDYDYPQPTDEHPFSISTDVAKTPWNTQTQLVRIGLQGKEYLNEELPASNLTFLIDVSGSMEDHNKLPLLISAFKLLVHQLIEKDKVSIVVYAGAAGVVLPPTNGDQKEKIINALQKLEAGGSTAGGQGIKLAYKLAEKNFKKNGNNRVILATDGDFNVGASSDTAMEKLIEKKRASGVFLSVLGFGMGNYKDSKLETLADKGNGNHAYIDTMQEAQKVFGDEFGGTLYTIAKDVKIQVEFNPAKVQAYRLIGYENRLLADEDFVDDTKDAGELGSGHRVTALYEVIPVGVKSDYLKEVSPLKYTNVVAADSYTDELFTVKFRYKKPNKDTSIEMVHIQKNEETEMSTDFKFASAVALFGLKLRKSQFTNNASYTTIIELAEQGRGEDAQGYRAEFIRLVNAAHKEL